MEQQTKADLETVRELLSDLWLDVAPSKDENLHQTYTQAIQRLATANTIVRQVDEKLENIIDGN